MARPSRPWYRLNRGWFVQINGKQHPLGVTGPGDEETALAALQKLLETLKNRPKAGPWRTPSAGSWTAKRPAG